MDILKTIITYIHVHVHVIHLATGVVHGSPGVGGTVGHSKISRDPEPGLNDGVSQHPHLPGLCPSTNPPPHPEHRHPPSPEGEGPASSMEWRDPHREVLLPTLGDQKERHSFGEFPTKEARNTTSPCIFRWKRELRSYMYLRDSASPFLHLLHQPVSGCHASTGPGRLLRPLAGPGTQPASRPHHGYGRPQLAPLGSPLRPGGPC